MFIYFIMVALQLVWHVFFKYNISGYIHKLSLMYKTIVEEEKLKQSYNGRLIKLK